MEVFGVVGDWPYSFQVLSNYGLYIYTFGVNLTSRAEVMGNNSLVPLSTRAVQLYFDTFSNQLASNDYGYAFLVTKNTSVSNFDVYLGGVAFNAPQNSKVLRMIRLP